MTEQYALQIRVNSGGPSEFWAFDSDFEVHDHPASAWDDMDAAEDMGYNAADLRVVSITAITERCLCDAFDYEAEGPCLIPGHDSRTATPPAPTANGDPDGRLG